MLTNYQKKQVEIFPNSSEDNKLIISPTSINFSRLLKILNNSLQTYLQNIIGHSTSVALSFQASSNRARFADGWIGLFYHLLIIPNKGD